MIIPFCLPLCKKRDMAALLDAHGMTPKCWRGPAPPARKWRGGGQPASQPGRGWGYVESIQAGAASASPDPTRRVHSAPRLASPCPRRTLLCAPLVASLRAGTQSGAERAPPPPHPISGRPSPPGTPRGHRRARRAEPSRDESSRTSRTESSGGSRVLVAAVVYVFLRQRSFGPLPLGRGTTSVGNVRGALQRRTFALGESAAKPLRPCRKLQ